MSDDDNVIQLFPHIEEMGDDSVAVSDWVEDNFGDFLGAVQWMEQSSTLAEFRAAKAEVEKHVRQWPSV